MKKAKILDTTREEEKKDRNRTPPRLSTLFKDIETSKECGCRQAEV